MTLNEIRECSTEQLQKYEQGLHHGAGSMEIEIGRLQQRIKHHMELANQINAELLVRPRPDCEHENFIEHAESRECEDCHMVVALLSEDEACTCGNTVSLDGFAPCDETGRLVEPLEQWSGVSRCLRCNAFVMMEAA